MMYRNTARACRAGVVNQAIIANVTAILFVPFARLYGFTYVQLGILAAAGFCAQLAADTFLLFFIDRLSSKKLAAVAASLSCAGLLFYGSLPYFFDELFFGILAATLLFAFAGGMLEVVLSNAAECALSESGGLCMQRTVYAWAQVALALFLLLFFALFGAERWNIAVLLLSAVPACVLLFLPAAQLPKGEALAPRRDAFRPFYLFALAAVFFGCGAEVAVNQYVSSFAQELFGQESGSLLGFAMFAACLGVGGTCFVFLKKRGAPFCLLLFSALLAGCCYLVAALAPAPAALAAAVACGLFVGVLSPGAMSAAGKFLPQTGGWLLASLALAQDVGGAALPAVMGATAEGAGIRTAFLCLSAAPFLAAVFLFLMDGIRKRAQK